MKSSRSAPFGTICSVAHSHSALSSEGPGVGQVPAASPCRGWLVQKIRQQISLLPAVMIRVRGLALLLMLLPERRASDTSLLQQRLAPRFAERCSLRPASLLALRGGLGSVPGVRVQQAQKPVPTKDPPIFGTTELLDAVTGGQHSRTVARFNYAMENEGRAPTVEELQVTDRIKAGLMRSLVCCLSACCW